MGPLERGVRQNRGIGRSRIELPPTRLGIRRAETTQDGQDIARATENAPKQRMRNAQKGPTLKVGPAALNPWAFQMGQCKHPREIATKTPNRNAELLPTPFQRTKPNLGWAIRDEVKPNEKC